MLALGEEGGGARGEEIAGVGPERPVDTALRAERARHGFCAADDRGEDETALDKDGPLGCGERVAEFGAASEPE